MCVAKLRYAVWVWWTPRLADQGASSGMAVLKLQSIVDGCRITRNTVLFLKMGAMRMSLMPPNLAGLERLRFHLFRAYKPFYKAPIYLVPKGNLVCINRDNRICSKCHLRCRENTEVLIEDRG